MQSVMSRAEMREKLKIWGCWTVMLGRLRREQAAVKRWLDEDGGEKAQALLKKIDAEIDQLISQRIAMTELVMQLPADEQRVLLLRYESGYTYLQIGRRIYYDERSVRRIESSAVDSIRRLAATK